jgi:hypothetical protein
MDSVDEITAISTTPLAPDSRTAWATRSSRSVAYSASVSPGAIRSEPKKSAPSSRSHSASSRVSSRRRSCNRWAERRTTSRRARSSGTRYIRLTRAWWSIEKVTDGVVPAIVTTQRP